MESFCNVFGGCFGFVCAFLIFIAGIACVGAWMEGKK